MSRIEKITNCFRIKPLTGNGIVRQVNRAEVAFNNARVNCNMGSPNSLLEPAIFFAYNYTSVYAKKYGDLLVSKEYQAILKRAEQIYHK